MDHKRDWLYDRKAFIRRFTVFATIGYTTGMIVLLHLLDPSFLVVWMILAVIGLIFGYISSLLMWTLYVLPNAERLSIDTSSSHDRDAK